MEEAGREKETIGVGRDRQAGRQACSLSPESKVRKERSCCLVLSSPYHFSICSLLSPSFSYFGEGVFPRVGSLMGNGRITTHEGIFCSMVLSAGTGCSGQCSKCIIKEKDTQNHPPYVMWCGVCVVWCVCVWCVNAKRGARQVSTLLPLLS